MPFLLTNIIDTISHILIYKYIKSDYLFTYLCLVNMLPLLKKRICNAIHTISTTIFPITLTQTLTKKLYVTVLPIFIKSKVATFVYKTIIKSFCLIPLNF